MCSFFPDGLGLRLRIAEEGVPAKYSAGSLEVGAVHEPREARRALGLAAKVAAPFRTPRRRYIID